MSNLRMPHSRIWRVNHRGDSMRHLKLHSIGCTPYNGRLTTKDRLKPPFTNKPSEVIWGHRAGLKPAKAAHACEPRGLRCAACLYAPHLLRILRTLRLLRLLRSLALVAMGRQCLLRPRHTLPMARAPCLPRSLCSLCLTRSRRLLCYCARGAHWLLWPGGLTTCCG
jgi:hypothetical protein